MNPLSFIGNLLTGKKSAPGKLQAGYESFEAAKRSGFRGWFYFPHLENPNKQLDQFTRLEIARKVNWLYNNVGIAKAIINRTARYEAGTGLWPKPRTSNRDWNRATMNRFHQMVKDPRIFDVAGNESFYSGQVNVLRHMRLHGDHFGQLILADGGLVRMRFIPSYSVDNALTSLDQSLWTQGVRRGPFGRKVAYRLIQSEDRTQFTDVSADDILHFHDYLWSGQVRGESMLAHACRHLFDIDDILRFEKNGVKLTSQIGYVLSSSTENPNGPTGGPQFALPGAQATEVVENDDGTKYTVQKIFNGEGSSIPEMPPGVDLKLIESKRPGASFTGFIDFLIRDVAWGSGYAPEFLWFLAGIGGAPMRFILEDSQTRIDDVRENVLKPQYCRRFYTTWLWQEMKAGRIDYPGEDWWQVDWLAPKKITVDKGREGRLDDDRLATGKTSPRLYFGELGLDEEEVEDDIIEAAFRRWEKVEQRAKDDEIPLHYRDIFLPPPGSANMVIVDPNAAGDATPDAAA
jgi:capsid protein